MTRILFLCFNSVQTKNMELLEKERKLEERERVLRIGETELGQISQRLAYSVQGRADIHSVSEQLKVPIDLLTNS